jgi:hypothetical protein
MLFLLFGFLGNDFLAFVVPTIRANGMGQAHLAAIAAGNQVTGFERIVRPTAILATF